MIFSRMFYVILNYQSPVANNISVKYFKFETCVHRERTYQFEKQNYILVK